MTAAAAAGQRWVTWRQRSGTVTAKTNRQDRDRVSRFVAAVGERPIGPAAVRTWAATLGVLAPASRRAHASTVRTWLRWCEAEGLACRGTSTAVPRYRAPAPVPRALTAAEVAALLDAAAGDDQLCIALHLFLGLGLRLHEVARLTTDDLDLAAGTVLVHGKGAAERMLPLPSRCTAELSVWTRGRAAGTPVFRSCRGGQLSTATLGRMVRRALEDADVKRTPGDGRSAHALRHTCASEVLEAGTPLHVLRDLLGHRSVATTSVYLRRADLGALRSAVAAR